MSKQQASMLITDSGAGAILENADKLLPVIEEVDNESDLSYLIGIPALVGLFFFLPGLLLGQFLPRLFTWLLIGLIIIFVAIFFVLASVSDKLHRKKYLRSAEAVGISYEQADEFYEFWNGLNSKSRKRIKKKRETNVKNQ